MKLKIKSRTILGIIFVIAALVCLHGFSAAMSREDGHTTKTMEQIEKAVFLQNGKVDEDNEGKPVIVRGKLHTAKEAHDTEMDLTFDSPYVERKLEVIGEDGKWTEDEDGAAAFFGKATLGEFKLSKDFLKDIKLTKGYTEFRESELGDLTVKEKYVYESDSKRYLYSYIPDRKELTLVGTQDGKTLQEIRGIECVREGSLSKADLKTDEDELNMPYLIGAAALSALFIVLACWMLGLFSKRKKEEEPSVTDEEWPEEDLGEDSIDRWLDEEMQDAAKTDAEEEQEEAAADPQNIELLDDLEALRAELEGRREEHREEQEESEETEAEPEEPAEEELDVVESDETPAEEEDSEEACEEAPEESLQEEENAEPEADAQEAEAVDTAEHEPADNIEETVEEESPEEQKEHESEGSDETSEEDEVPENPEEPAEADSEAEMLALLQNNWAAKQQKKKTAQTSSLKQRGRKKPQQKKSGKSGKKKQARRRR